MLMNEITEIQVEMACYAIGQSPEILSARGLGSCVALTLYDNQKKIGALGHIMLPNSISNNAGGNPLRFADCMVEAMLVELAKRGSTIHNLEAKLVGGANMFPFLHQEIKTIPLVGDLNVKATKDYLLAKNITLASEEVGGHYGRSVQFHLDSGVVSVEKKI